ncbi:transporter substrate-binding domain-containing protein (plasmid) [Rhizobium acidisoli]|uniref:Transporter substrate-binding domain-containing protein n=1 Tax=Rhizobium acidisoli TaxID=1538158 RepID=A0AAE6C255_9HYPH|nr:transporter substrate-binding domain-containing protein [Rhizobium acidisoli]KPH04563.1 amino acid ABC transporter substrate-binding protein [Rhizobium acidisoli]QAS81162.1 transporter substrate-binding domain-containing protein [Rhizobium acidisoli]
MSKSLISAAAAALIAVVSTALPANAGAVLDQVQAAKTLTVATSSGWPNSSFLNDKQELDGFEIEVAKGVAKHLGVSVKFVTPGWDVIVAGKWAGRWDMAMGQMVPTKARAEKFDFPAIYFYTRNVAVIHKDSKATKLSDLDGKVIGLVTGDDAAIAYARHNLTLDWADEKPLEYKFTPGEMRNYENTGLQADDLRLGDGVRLDAIITDEVSAQGVIKAGYPLRVLGDALFPTPGAIAILKGDKEFSDKIAAAIKSMKDDGTLSKLSIKWYGIDSTAE